MASVDEISEAIMQMAASNAEEVGPALEAILHAIFKKGDLPRDAIGMSPETIEGMYSQAFNHYNSGQYIESARLFHTLQMLDGTEPKFQLGLGASYQMLEEYQNAITVYAYMGVLDPENPVPHFHSSDCYLKMDLTPAAIAELEMTVELCGDQPKFQMIKDRSELYIQQLQDKGELDEAAVTPPAVDAPEE